MAIKAKDVAALRRQTGAGMMDCKKALVEAEGDVAKATEILQKKNLAATAKRAGRIAAEGAVGSYIHGTGSIGVLVEINCETDFVGRGEIFQELVKNVAMHIAAAAPRFLDETEIPEDEVAQQKKIFLGQMEEMGKPAHILEKIIVGKIAKWKREICLVDQTYVRNTDLTVDQYVKEVASSIKENLKIRRFMRFEMGEGLEKKGCDFAAEVAAAVA